MAERATVARPYAKAAFAYAREQGKLDAWSGWLGTARSVVESDEYAAYERSPGVQTRQLVELLAGVCGGALDANARAFLDLLAENGRLDYLPEIAERFEELKAEDANVADVAGHLGRAARRGAARASRRAPCAHDCAATCGCIALSILR